MTWWQRLRAGLGRTASQIGTGITSIFTTRKLDADTLTSIGTMGKHTQIKDQDSTKLSAEDMIAELLADNETVIARLKGMKDLAEEAGDNATDGLLDDWTDMAEQRAWFLRSLLA